MDVLARMEGFWVCILFFLLYFFVVCEHLGRLFQHSLKYLQVKPIRGKRVSRSGQSAFAIYVPARDGCG